MKRPHIIKKSMTGEAVTWVQVRVNFHLGAPRVVPDGKFDDATERRVMDFQRKHKLTVDGIAGPATQAHLAAKPGKMPSSKPSVIAKLPKPKPAPAPKRATTGQRLATQMEAWVGLAEKPRGSNVVPHLKRLALRHGWSKGVAAMGFSWCNFAMHLALKMIGCRTLVASGTWSGHTGMYVPATEAKLAELAKRGLARKIPVSRIERGDILIFDWNGGEADHIGVARGAEYDGEVPTVEANTSPSNAGSQSNGDGVYKRIRPTSTIQSAWRLD